MSRTSSRFNAGGLTRSRVGNVAQGPEVGTALEKDGAMPDHRDAHGLRLLTRALTIRPPQAQQEATDRDAVQQSGSPVEEVLHQAGGRVEEQTRKASEDQAHETNVPHGVAGFRSILKNHLQLSIDVQSVRRYQIMSATLTIAMVAPTARRSQLQRWSM